VLLQQAFRLLGAMQGPAPSTGTLSSTGTLKDLHRRALIEALDATGWVQRKAAMLLGINERTMSYQMQVTGLRVKKAERLARI
jgi:transcriptional regulator with GAF, ATPase, and Fis domain